MSKFEGLKWGAKKSFKKVKIFERLGTYFVVKDTYSDQVFCHICNTKRMS
jgi:hypothetical protein